MQLKTVAELMGELELRGVIEGVADRCLVEGLVQCIVRDSVEG